MKEQNHRHSLQHRYSLRLTIFNNFKLLFNPVNNFRHLYQQNKSFVFVCTLLRIHISYTRKAETNLNSTSICLSVGNSPRQVCVRFSLGVHRL